MFFGLLLAFLMGLGLMTTGWNDPSFSLASQIFGVVCGLILMAPFVMIVLGMLAEQFDSKKGNDSYLSKWISELKKKLVKTVKPVSKSDDFDDSVSERFVRHFRNSLKMYYAQSGIDEDNDLKKDVTQILYHIIRLHKKRLDSKDILLDYKVERYDYKTLPKLEEHSFFDGKYEIKDLKETIRASKKYWKNRKLLKNVSNQEVAEYRLINARIKDSKYICPNCSAEQSLESLIDGCDYCKTKFRVEDLNEKISRFEIRSDAQTEYAAYKAKRSVYLWRFDIIVGIPVYVIVLISFLLQINDISGSFVARLLAVIVGTVIVSLVIMVLLWLGFLFFVFPFIQTGFSYRYLFKRAYESASKHRNDDLKHIRKAHEFDPLFSVNSFYSYVCNQLALIHYSSNATEASGFIENEETEKYLKEKVNDYKDVIDMSVKDISLIDYSVDDKNQKATVRVDLELLKENDGKVRKNREMIKLCLFKNKNLKAQEVCPPSFLSCPNCNASVSLLEGRRCTYCGSTRKLSDYDWAIDKYQIIKEK